jgi:hypothetical protein
VRHHQWSVAAKDAFPGRDTGMQARGEMTVRETLEQGRSARFQPHVELNSHFIFGADARFSGRLNSKVCLLHGNRGVPVRHFGPSKLRVRKKYFANVDLLFAC